MNSRRKWFFPPRTLNQLMSLVALSGLALAGLTPRGGVMPSRPRAFLPPSRLRHTSPVPPRAQQLSPLDARFIIVAPEHLDPNIVVTAPQGIDDRMIVRPSGEAVGNVMPDVWPIPIPIPPPWGR